MNYAKGGIVKSTEVYLLGERCCEFPLVLLGGRMKVRLTCTYKNDKGEKLGEFGSELESPRDASAEELKRLVAGGSATLVEPPKKSERD